MTELLHVPSQVPAVAESRKVSEPWLRLWTTMTSLLNRGIPGAVNNAQGQLVPQSITIVTAKLTPGGANGSQTFTNGILTAETPAT